MKPTEILPAFDAFLQRHRLRFEAIVIGGAALNLLGVISRETQDCDILDPTIPKEIELASEDFAKEMRGKGIDLRPNWLNHGPESLKRDLPASWQRQLIPLYAGKNLVLQTLGRADLLRSKLYAYCDRAQDLGDCIALKPTREELLQIIGWVQAQDTNPMWPKHVEESFKNLAKRLGYEL